MPVQRTERPVISVREGAGPTQLADGAPGRARGVL